MRGVAAVLCVCAGCGRFAFDDVPEPGTVDAAIDGPPSGMLLVDALPCETDVVLRAVPRVDQLAWVGDGYTLAVGAIVHLDNTHHEIHFYPLAVAANSVASPTDVQTYATSDMYGMSVLETGNGYAMAVSDLADGQVHLFVLDAEFAARSNTTLTAMGTTAVPLARSTAGVRVVGTTANGVGMQVLDAANAPVGAAVDIATGTSAEPSITPIGADFVVGWDALADCAFERVSAEGTVLAGPLIVDPPGSTACASPLATATAGGIVYSVVDRTDSVNPVAYAAGGDAGLASATVPVAIGAVDSTVTGAVDDGTRALVAVRTNGDSRVVAVTPAGAATPLGSDFGLAGTDIDAEAITSVHGSIVHARTEAGMLQIRKLCR